MRSWVWVYVFLFLACGRTGAEWLPADLSTTKDVRRILGSAGNDVYAVGTQGLVAHYDGKAWRTIDISSPATVEDLFIASSSEVWLVGESGLLLRGDRTGWKRVTGGPSERIAHIGGTGPNDVWLATSSNLYWYDGSTFRVVEGRTRYGTPDNYFVDDIAGDAAAGVWIIADDQVHRAQFGVLTPVEVGATGYWETLAVAGPKDVWLSDGQRLFRYDGARWSAVTLPNEPGLLGTSWYSIKAGWATAPNDVWFVGSGGEVLHFDGAELKLDRASDHRTTLSSIWAASRDDVWVAGSSGAVLRRYVATSP